MNFSAYMEKLSYEKYYGNETMQVYIVQVIQSVILKCREIQFTTKISVTSDGSYPHLCTAEIFAVPAFLNSSAEHHVLTWIDKYPEMQVNKIHAISDKHYKVSFFVKQSPWKYTYFFEYELI